VACQSGAQTITLASSGSIKVMALGATMGVPNTQAGIICPIATLNKTRIPKFPDVPTVGEAVFPLLESQWYSGISRPHKLPAYIEAKWKKHWRNC